MAYKLTYSTMFDPPPGMHTRFEAALGEVRGGLGRKHALHIAGKDVDTGTCKDKRSPIDRDWLLGSFAQAVLLSRNGYPDVWQWSDQALLRSVAWLHEECNFPAESDDTWQPHVVNYFYGSSYPAPVPSTPGKNVGWTDFTLQ